MAEAKLRVETVCLCILAILAVAIMLVYTQSIMVPCVLAGFVTFIVAPSVNLLETKCKMPRIAAVAVTALGVILLATLAAMLVVSSVKQALGNLGAYQSSIIGMVNQVTDLATKLGVDPEEFGRAELLEQIRNQPIFSYLQTVAKQLIGGISNFVLILLIVVFLLTGKALTLPNSATLREIESKVRTYLVTKVVTSAATGLLTAIILLILGVDMAIMFGFLAFVLNFIPTVGSLVATLLPIPVAMLQFGFGIHSLLAVVLPGLVQFSVGNVLEPKFMGDSLDLHPVAILVALLFWGLIWGVPGMILATPILVIGKIILKRTTRGKFLAELMAGRFA